MILVDTNVLVALVDERERLHARVSKELKRAAEGQLLVTTSVLAEAFFLLPAAVARRRLRFLLQGLHVRWVGLLEDELADVLEWLERYEEHEPDFADGEIVVLSGRDRSARVWTHDAEFRSIWRRSDGSPVPLFGGRG